MKKDADKNTKEILALGKKIGSDYIKIGKDWVSLVTETTKAATGAAGSGATGGAATNEGLWETVKEKKAAGPAHPYGSIEGRESERSGAFEARDAERAGAFSDRWAGSGMAPKEGATTQFEKALKPSERKLDAIAHNTENLDFKNQ